MTLKKKKIYEKQDMICERNIYNLIALQKSPSPIKLMAPSYHLVTESPPVHESKIKHHALVEDMDENGVPHRNNDSSRPRRYGHHRQPQKEGQSPHVVAPIAYLARASQGCLWK
uniref:Uncharacterized protein n=1 Tax=Populus trichocarpa TaxID=3694 RepID=B9HRG6_POPTR